MTYNLQSLSGTLRSWLKILRANFPLRATLLDRFIAEEKTERERTPVTNCELILKALQPCALSLCEIAVETNLPRTTTHECLQVMVTRKQLRKFTRRGAANKPTSYYALAV